MNVCKAAFWIGDGCSWRCNMYVGFGFLACYALAVPNGNIGGHVRPNKTGWKQAAGGSDTWVIKGLYMFKNLLLEGRGNQRAKSGSGNITKQ